MSFGVLVRHDGSARSSWFRTTGGLAAGVEGQQQQWRDYLELAEKNAALAEQNAQLRSQLLSMERESGWRMDAGSGWSVATGRLIKGPDGHSRSMALGIPGADAGLTLGMGVLSAGVAIGTVVDVGERYTRIPAPAQHRRHVELPNRAHGQCRPPHLGWCRSGPVHPVGRAAVCPG